MSFQTMFDFETALAEYTGAPYVVVTDGCTHSIELAMRLQGIKRCEFTAFTYLSIVQNMAILNIDYHLTDEQWQGEYQFHGTNIWDSARRLEPGMYRSGQVQCLSFGRSKPMSIGRVGAILLDDYQAWYDLSCMRSDGRDLRVLPWETQTELKIGYHYWPTLENCEQGLQLLPTVQPQNQKANYPDCRKIQIVT